jgi:hypothetical protein
MKPRSRALSGKGLGSKKRSFSQCQPQPQEPERTLGFSGTNLSRARWTSGGGSWRSKSEVTASSHTQETTIPRSLDHHKMPREET